MAEDEIDAAVRRVLSRNRRIGSFRDWLAAFLILAFVSSLPLLVWKVIPEGNKETIVYILGQISGMALTVVGFYFVSKSGEDELTAKRTENTGKALDAITAANKQAAPIEEPAP